MSGWYFGPLWRILLTPFFRSSNRLLTWPPAGSHAGCGCLEVCAVLLERAPELNFQQAPPEACMTCHLSETQRKTQRRLELSISKNTPGRRWGQGPGHQRIAKGAGGKGPRQKTSKSVKKFFRHFSTIFAQGKKRQKVFQHFSTFFARHHFSGPFWGALKDSVDPGFPAGLPFQVPEIPEFIALCDSETCSSYFPGAFSWSFPRHPKYSRNSHCLLDFSEKPPPSHPRNTKKIQKESPGAPLTLKGQRCRKKPNESHFRVFLGSRLGGFRERLRDKPKGTNRAKTQISADFRCFLQILCLFPEHEEAQIFAGNRRFSQETAENRRNPQKTADWRLSPWAFCAFRAGRDRTRVGGQRDP